MAFDTNNIATLAEIPALVATFAASQGWTVDSTNPSAPLLTRPGGGLPVLVQGFDGLPNGLGEINLSSPANAGARARTLNIRINGTAAAPVIPTPTRLFLFSGTEESSAFIAGVIEFGFNRYRMFYIGNMVRKGNYTGGEVIAGNAFQPETVSFRYPLTTDDHKYLFKGTQSFFTSPADTGWVHVIHPESDTLFKPFFSSLSVTVDPVQNIDVGSVFGGNFDNVNDTLLVYGEQHFAAANLINPVQLYEGVGTPRFLRPLGHPAGARSVNMTNLSPGQQITVGSINWRVYPEFRKSDLTSISQGPNATSYAADESSVFAGMAFPENLAT